MPLSYQTHSVSSSASGSGLQFSVTYSFLLKAHVKLYYGLDILAGTSTSLLVDGVDYNWTSSTQVTLTSAPSSNQTLTIIRDTPDSTQQVVWQDGSNLIADDMNTADRQNLFVVQEQQDRNDLAATKAIDSETASNAATTAVNQAVLADGTRAMTGNLNANSNKVVNLANPTAGGDAVNKTFADATYQPLDAELTELATMAGNTAAALADLTQAEVNILDGATVSTSELNTLDGVTASTAELNKLDGVTSSTAELNILDGVTATASELNALDGITASTTELNKLDGVTASTAELNTVDGVTSAIQTQLDGKQPLDAELTELATMQSTTASALADLTQAEVQILDGATVSTAELNTLDGITSTTTELNVLDGVTATTTELNVTDGLTASTSELNQLDGKTISSTLTPANTNDIPTSSAVNTFVSGLLNALGGFVAIPNETSFPTTNPDPSDNAGTVVSIADAGGVVVNSSGVSTTGRTTSNATVTINGFPSSLQSSTLAAGLGLQVQTTTTLNTYTYHKLIAKETDITQLSDDINDFNARYRVSANAPTTDLDAGDLWFDTTAGKMKVYDANDSAWEEVQSVGSFFINTLSSSSGTGGGSATFNGSAYRFTLSNAGASAQQMLVSVNGVIQKPNSGTSQPSEGFAIQNNDIIFAAAPASGASHFIVTIGSTVNVGQPSNNTVDTSELVDGAVTNAKVSSSAAIAGTKISPNFGSQDVVTTGRVGIGNTTMSSFTGNASDNLVVGSGSGGEGITVYSGTNNQGSLTFADGTSGDAAYRGAVEYNHTADRLAFRTAGTGNRMVIDSSGNVGVGTTSPFRSVHVSGSSDQYVRITSTNSANAGIEFGDSDDPGRANVIYSNSTDSMHFTVNGSERLRIDSSGRIGINTSSPNYLLTALASSGSQNIFQAGQTGVSNGYTISSNGSALTHQWYAGSGEAARIDSLGRLLVGTSTSPSGGDGHSQNAPLLVQGRIGSDADSGRINLQRGSAASSGSSIGTISFTDNSNNAYARLEVEADAATGSNDYPGRFKFSTTADGASSPTERMRIGNDGKVYFGDFGSAASAGYIDKATSGSYELDIVASRSTTTNRDIRFFSRSNSESMRIDTAGNVAIGDTSAPDKLNVGSTSNGFIAIRILTSNTGNGEVRFGDSDSGNSGYIRYAHNGNHLIFARDGAEAMRVSTGGRLLIGTTATSVHGDRLIEIGNTSRSGTYQAITTSTSGTGGIVFADSTTNDTGGYRGIIQYAHSSDSLQFSTAATERQRIDSSGRVLIGSGAINAPKVNTGGIDISTHNIAIVFGGSGLSGTNTVRTNNAPKDGRIAAAHYANAEEPVGVIRVVSNSSENQLHWGGGSSIINAATDHRFYTASNNTTTGGTERMRVTNNGLTFNGDTAAANALDDYEEGTWTPTITGLGNHTNNASNTWGKYTKVGNRVFITFRYSWTSRSTTNGGVVRLASLPFTAANDSKADAIYIGGLEGIMSNTGRESYGGYVVPGTTTIQFRASGHDVSENSLFGSLSTSLSTGYIYAAANYIV